MVSVVNKEGGLLIIRFLSEIGLQENKLSAVRRKQESRLSYPTSAQRIRKPFRATSEPYAHAIGSSRITVLQS